MAAGSNTAPDELVGLVLTGEYLGVKREQGRERTGPDGGRWPDRFKIGVRVGTDVFDIEYRTVDAAQLALTRLNGAGEPSKGDRVSLHVRARSAKGYTFWMGADEAAGGGDYE